MANQAKPLVSIILSTFNNEATIGTGLSSLNNQIYSNFEIIVVDEYSQDKTFDIAKQYDAKVYQMEGERSNCRNFGIKKAQGGYVLVLDSDMTLEPSVLEECVDLAQKGARAIVIREISEGEGFWSQVRALERSFYAGDVNLEAARFFEKKLILEIGGYDPRIVGAEDWDVQQKIINSGISPERTKSYIIHHEGRLKFWRLIKKKVYYGAAFNEFSTRYPKVFMKTIFRTALFKSWRSLIRYPIRAIGVFCLKFCEGLALFWGMKLSSRGKRAAHY